MDSVGIGAAKLILFGEHAAVHGFPAVGVQLPERTIVTLHGARADAWSLEDVAAEDHEALRNLMGALERLLPELEKKSISIRSTVPRGVGFGSSAALCAALAAAALGSRSVGVWEMAHRLERVFHGTPSGIDTGLSFLPGVTAFEPKPPALPGWERVLCSPLWLVVGAVPRSDNSAALIRGIGERMKSGDPRVREALAGLGKIAAEAKQRLVEPAPAAIAQLADQAQKVLRELGLSTSSLDEVLEEGRRSGALGGKLSGAGGGGAFFLVCESEHVAQDVAASLGPAAPFASVPRPVRIREETTG